MSVSEEKLCMISINLLHVVMVEVSLADIEDAHSTIYWLIKYELSSLHVDRNKMLIKYSAMLEVWFCWKVQRFLAVVD